MKKTLFILFTVFGLGLMNGFSQTAVPGCVDGRIYLKYKPTAVIKYKNPANIDPKSLPGMEVLIGKYGVNFAEKPYYQATDDADLMRIYKVGFSNLNGVEDLIRDIATNPLVEYAEKVPLCVTTYTTNDPTGPTYSANQWFLNKINAQNAWNVFNSTTNGTSTITVAICDNAIMRTHPDLSANIWVNPGEIPGNFIDDDGNGYVDDVNGFDVADNDNSVLPPSSTWSHGTHCAGIAGARNDNTVGISSIGHNIKIMPVKATVNTSTTSMSITHPYAAIVYAARSKAKVISCSFGGSVSAASDQAVITYAWNKGCIVVVSAGNNGNTNMSYPAAYTNAYSVVNTDNTDAKAGSSTYGTWTDISAPGQNIYSTVPNTGYTYMSGTSMACPLVAGLAGLMLSKNAYLTPTQVLNCISTTANNHYTVAANSGFAGQLGAGRIDAYAAMVCASVTAGSPPSADFTSDKQNTCPNMPIKFKDLSTLYPTSWSWTFQSGSPAVSTASAPTVSWTTAGTYSVGLTVNNLYGPGSVTKIGYITITNAGSLPLVEGFQGAAWPPVNWVDDNKNSDSIHYTRANTCGGFGLSSSSLFFDNYYLDAGGVRDGFEMPKLNMSSVTNASLTFDVAFARYDATYSDTLELQLSTNCGATWTSIFMKGGTALSTAPDFTSALWVPTAAQWRKEGINITTLSAGQSNVLMKFVNHGHYGNGMYLDNVNLSYTLAAAPAANYNYPATICSGAAMTFTDTSTNSPTSWSWNMPGASITTSTLQNPSVTYATGGVYSVTLTATNGAGSNNSIKTFTVIGTPTVAATGVSSVCAGSSATLSATGATTYTWNPGSLTGTSVVVTPTSTTTYSIVGATGACSGSTTKLLTITPNPTVAVASTTICTGGTATLTASGATTYSWSTGSTATSINPTPASTTVYTVTGTTSGCTNIRTATVTVAPAPTVAVNSATICSGQSANLTASGATTYTWSSGPTTTSITVSPTITTNYTVTGANGTCVNSRTTSVVVNALPSLTLASSSGTACTISSGGITLNLTGNPAGGVYSGPGVVGSTFTAQTAAGTFTATYSYTNATTGCANSVNTTITVAVCTGINVMNLLDGQIIVYPNPNGGVFTLQANFDEAYDVTIYNNIGQIVNNTKNLKGNNDLNLSGFATGIYNVVVNANGSTKTIKMVIE